MRMGSCRLFVGFTASSAALPWPLFLPTLAGVDTAADQNLGLADYRVPKFKEICFKVTSDQGFILKPFPIIPEEGSRN